MTFYNSKWPFSVKKPKQMGFMLGNKLKQWWVANATQQARLQLYHRYEQIQTLIMHCSTCTAVPLYRERYLVSYRYLVPGYILKFSTSLPGQRGTKFSILGRSTPYYLSYVQPSTHLHTTANVYTVQQLYLLGIDLPPSRIREWYLQLQVLVLGTA